MTKALSPHRLGIAFEFGKAAMLVAVTTIFGYIGGVIFGYLHKLLEE